MKFIVEAFYGWYKKTIRNSKYGWIVILASLVYLISPIDISTDVVPIVGWIDDGVVATLLATEVSQMLVEYRKRRKGENSDETIEASTTRTTDETVIDVKAE